MKKHFFCGCDVMKPQEHENKRNVKKAITWLSIKWNREIGKKRHWMAYKMHFASEKWLSRCTLRIFALLFRSMNNELKLSTYQHVISKRMRYNFMLYSPLNSRELARTIEKKRLTEVSAKYNIWINQNESQ